MCCPRGNPVDNVPVFAVVKEVEEPEPLDDDKLLGIAEFENEYFYDRSTRIRRAPSTRRSSKPIFTLVVGKNALESTQSPCELKEMGERFKNGLAGNMKGDGRPKAAFRHCSGRRCPVHFLRRSWQGRARSGHRGSLPRPSK